MSLRLASRLFQFFVLASLGCASGPGADAGDGGAGLPAAGGGPTGSGANAAGGSGGLDKGAGGRAIAAAGMAAGGGEVGGTSGHGGSGASASGGAGLAGGSGGGPPVDQPAPDLLSETGLYQTDMETLADGVHFFAPNYPLWTDGAAKKRWVWLPPGTQIDTHNMDFWQFPVGTKLWKEFVRDGVRVETRWLHKQPSGEWAMMAYQWRDDQLEADAVAAGVMNASGTSHDIPTAEQCGDCHLKVPDKGIGFSAVQLSHAPAGTETSEWTLQSLVSAGLLSDAPTGSLEVPGNDVEKAALGYLHANCGHCHNPRSAVSARVSFFSWLTVDSLTNSAAESPAYTTGVGHANSLTEGPSGIPLRIAPGDPAMSSVYVRMQARGPMYSMPPLGTEDQDTVGLSAVAAWISAVPPL